MRLSSVVTTINESSTYDIFILFRIFYSPEDQI